MRAILRGARGCAGAQGYLGGGVRLRSVSTGNAGGVREENVLAARQNLVDGHTVLRHELHRDGVIGAQVQHLNHVRLLNIQALVNADFQGPLIVQGGSHLGSGHSHSRHGTVINGNSDQANLQIL